MNFRTFGVLLRCTQCGAGMGLPGPVRAVRCGTCLADTAISDELVARVIMGASDNTKLALSGEQIEFSYSIDHACPGCSAPVDLRAFPIGEESERACEECGAKIASFPPPAWLKELLPGLAQMYGAERGSTEALVPPSELIDPEPARPVVMRCPECGSGLKATTAGTRMVTCDHCNSQVYLPDDLWRTMHPVKRITFWTVAWEGWKLKSIGQIRDEEAFMRAREEREAAQAKSDLEAGRQRELDEHKRVQEMRASRRNERLLLLFAAGIAIVFAYIVWTEYKAIP